MPEISVARADVAKIYIAAFDRIPDAGGLDFWVSSYMSGENTLESIAQLFTNSTEYKTAYPSSISTAEYVEKIYINVFNRASDADGKKFWVNALTAGALTNGTLMKAMVDAASANGSTDGFMLTNQATFGIWAADNKISFETANAQLSSITYDDSTLANAKSTISTSLTPSSLDLSSADDTGSSYTDNITQNTSALTISGNAAAGSTVKLYDTNGTTLLGTGTATSSGTFSIDVSLSEGTHSLTGKATTTSGTSSSASSTLSITVDKTAPIAHLTSITDNVGSVTGILSSGATTDDTSLAMTGTCESGSTVNIYNGTTLLGTATTSNTSWTYNALVSEGTTYQFNVKETDKAGNISASTSNVTITGASNTQTINAGILNQNTTWESGKTYLIDGVLQINRGVTLTIQSGAKIIGGKIDVFGSLIVDGTSSNKVEITNTTIGIGDNEYTEIALIDIDFANISNSNIYSPTGNSIYGKINLTNSTLTNNEYMYLWYPTGDCTISKNIFINTDISIGISDNRIINITNNAFSNSDVTNWASYATSNVNLQYNSFLNGSNVKLQYDSGKMDAMNNYWGTTNLSSIESYIYDNNDSSSLTDTIEFNPILTTPHYNTPLL